MSETIKLSGVTGAVVSLQVACYGVIEVKDRFKLIEGGQQIPFRIKNNTEEAMTVTLVDARGNEVETTLDPGWNPEIVYELANYGEGLIYGY